MNGNRPRRVHSDVPPHEKIRFSRSDLKDLDNMPSSLGHVGVESRGNRPGRLLKAGFAAFAGLSCAVIGLVALVQAALHLGVGQERLRFEAERAVSDLFGEDFNVSIGRVGLGIDPSAHLALEVHDAVVFSAVSAEAAMQLDNLRFQLRLLPLLRGHVRVASADLDGARVAVNAVQSPRQGKPNAILDQYGRIDPDGLLDALFDGASRGMGTLRRLDVDSITLSHLELGMRPGAATSLHIDHVELEGSPDGKLALTAGWAVGAVGFSTTATFQGTSGEAASEEVSVVVDLAPSGDGSAHALGRHTLQSARLEIRGERQGSEENVAIAATLDEFNVVLADGDRLAADIELRGRLRRGENKLEIESLSVRSGRSNWRFDGAIGPVPAGGDVEQVLGYRFELVTNGSTIAPEGSPEAALDVVARVAGTVSSDGRQIDMNQIGLRTPQGEVSAGATVLLEPGRSPGLDLRLDVASMPTGQVKQLWPWFAARGARAWVLSNIFGGRVGDGYLQLSAEPGRMGNGVPFGPSEVSGRFSIEGTRFDVAGRIPPVRDARGVVEFRGTDVDVALSRGTVFMPGDRTVDASDGTLEIRAAHEKPVIGKLQLGVKGNADAVLALAAYDPIDVGRYVDIVPDEVTGAVEGVVQADIPLQANIPAESLDWKVDLTYSDLDLARPFEGQVVADASGRISVNPEKAAIDASATLNGAPATIHMVEPFGDGPLVRERRISLMLDDKARAALAPGLDSLLSGTTKVDLDDSVAGTRSFVASLDRSTLKIPWAGWSKGAGIPGEVRFTMRTAGDRIDLADFSLAGTTFGARGSISLAGGEIARVTLPQAKLNRGDDFSFDLTAQGGGYAITIRGRSIDARSVVKLYSQDGAGGGEGTSSPVPISLDLAVDEMTGFHGEVFRDVKLAYAGTGTRTDRLEFSATTRNGASLTFRDGRDGGARSVRMQSADAGSVLRFLDIYEHMEGGSISLALTGAGEGPLRGQVDARDFWIVNEPRLRSLVSTAPQSDARSVSQAVRGEIDTTRVRFERGFSQVEKGTGLLKLAQGVLRGPLIGSTFQGTFYDSQGNMDMTGTFMPAYGINRIFGEIPLFGAILGNGRDRGLIGITFRLAGKSADPQLQINPLSIIAPGIFRSVFEFR